MVHLAKTEKKAEKKPKKAKKRHDRPTEYWLIKEYAKAKISKKGRMWNYEVTEPPISTEQLGRLDEIKKHIVDVMDADIELVENNINEYIESEFQKFKEKFKSDLSKADEKVLKYYLLRDFVGLERIEPLMHDPNIEDISCDGLNIPIYISHKDYGSVRTSIVFKNLKELENFTLGKKNEEIKGYLLA